MRKGVKIIYMSHSSIRSVHVIIAKYKEDISWSNNIKYPYTIICKEHLAIDEIPNRGNEASTYLEYIYKNYYNLADYNVFLHGHQKSYHHTENMDETLNNMIFDMNYRNINNKSIYNDLRKMHFNVTVDWLKQYEKNVLESILYCCVDFDKIASNGNAQFYVSKQFIHRHSQQTYINLYIYIMKHKYNSYYTSRVFEYLWYFILTGEFVEIDNSIYQNG